MPSRKKKNISYFNTNVTSIISVSMVLLLLGIVALIGVAANEATRQIRENVGIDVSMSEIATDSQVDALKRELTHAAYAASVKYVSKDEALMLWKEDTGEDLMEVIGFNPLTAEFEVHVKSKYASVDSLNHISAMLKRSPVIDEVKVHTDQVEAMNRSVRQTATILLVVAVAMMIISLALINNTVRMTVYSRRFLIHTMKLVGATPGFIRKPIVVSNMLNGVVAACIATALLGGIVYYLSLDGLVGAAVTMLVPVGEMLMIGVALAVVGAVLCAVAAYFAANKYIKLDYDRLF